MGYSDLVSAGADAVKVGISNGHACSTRAVTGFGVPQFSAIYECAKVAQKLRVAIIADGGIRGPADVSKALAAGASTVMMGKIFAATRESAALKEMHEDGSIWASYRGQASAEFQMDYYGGVKSGTVAEGRVLLLEGDTRAQDVLDYYSGALRSAYTYGGARDI